MINSDLTGSPISGSMYHGPVPHWGGGVSMVALVSAGMGGPIFVTVAP